MGNSWKGISDEKLDLYEKQIFTFSGLSEDEFEIKNVIIDEQGNFIRTVTCGNPNN